MKKILSPIVLALILLAAPSLRAQTNNIALDATTHDTVVYLSGGQVSVSDDNKLAGGAYSSGHDYHLTIHGSCNEPYRIAILVEELSVSCLDTVYIYEGTSVTGTPLVKFNSFTGNVNVGDYIFESPANTTGAVTIRFVTDPLTDSTHTSLPCYADNSGTYTGFKLDIMCKSTCASTSPVIEDKFYRTRNGEVYDSGYVHMIYIYDTIFNPDGTIQELVVTDEFLGANLCIGDGVIFRGHGEYKNTNDYYHPTDATSYFRWDMDNDGDTLAGIGLTEIEYDNYQRTGCFEVRLTMQDEMGCFTGQRPSIRVRTAMNPIMTVYSLDDICNNKSLRVDIGYEGDNATITIARIQSDSAVTKRYEARTFIPDGVCDGQYYFEAPVTFQEFSSGRQVQSASDICSICINMEHSYMGDIYITIVCPNDKEAILKFGNPKDFTPPYNDPSMPIKSTLPGGETGSSAKLGLPLHSSTITNISANQGDDMKNVCDSTLNPPGIGMDYCFSRDTAYRLAGTGERAGDVWTALTPNPSGNYYIGSTDAPVKSVSVSFPAIPAGFVDAGTVPTPKTSSIGVRQPSDHENKLNYYLPYSQFNELVGCDLNGEWKIRVYDCKNKDNGWIFSWTMDICDFKSGSCDYQVGIDSIVWEVDPSPQYHDYDMGYYRGAVVDQVTPLTSYISTPDTAGTFPILVHIYDEFGCEWDTTSRITSFWNPMPDLGPDTALCGINQMLLDANDKHSQSPSENYTFNWFPFGQTTDTITTMEEPGGTIQYIVEVTNTMGKYNLACRTYDTINVGTRPQPMPSVLPTPFVFEGCDPFTLEFDNQSLNADEHLWIFGDGTTSTDGSPVHTYTEGTYDLKYYAMSKEGCIDSIISPNAVVVFPSPKAAFSWMPTYPSVTNPIVHFNNETTQRSPNTRFFWEMQYDLTNPFSVQTVVDENPDFDFTMYTNDNPAGNYEVKLIARSDNQAPTGTMVYCPDTAINNILVVNDFLQFPNVVSPNGDGINDRFVIKNLIEGLGFPSNSLDIYNKWGTRVYHIENINNPDDFWDPSDVPTGTYYYHFTARGFNGSIEHNGVIEVIR